MGQERTYREEGDSLGTVRVPADRLYGAQTQRAVENFPVSGMRPWRAFIWSMATIKRAAAKVNCDLGLLEQDVAEAIMRAAQEVAEGGWERDFVVDPFQAGAGTSHNMNANEVIANRATQILGGDLGAYWVHPNDHVNMGQSTNDTIPTAIRLGCLWRLEELKGVLDGLAGAMREKAEAFDEVIKSGRTHLQDAVPIRLGQEFGGYARAVERQVRRLELEADGLRRLGIGGTAVGTGLNAHEAFHSRMVETLAEWTGWELRGAEDLFETTQSMEDPAAFSGALRVLAITLTRIANDLRLLSSGPATGLNEITLPAVQPGSSIMPGKVNPVMAEMLNMAMYHVMGCDHAVAMAAQAGQLELNVMMPIIAHNLFEMMQVTIGSVRAFTERCVVGIQANRDQAERWLQQNPIVVTALNPLIGYAAGAELVKEAQRRGRTVQEVAQEHAREGALLHREEGRPLTVEEVTEALGDLRRLTEGGIVG
jgi:fumarate hydratase class II